MAATAPLSIRPVDAHDLPFLWDMLYEAAIVAPEIRALTKSVALAMPVITRWLAGWGRDGDVGLVATTDGGEPTGAAWYRLYALHERGDGIVAWPGVPEISIGVRPADRGRGIGTDLLMALIARARDAGRSALLLSVDPANPAVRLYRRCGFSLVETDDPAIGTSLLMKAELTVN